MSREAGGRLAPCLWVEGSAVGRAPHGGGEPAEEADQELPGRHEGKRGEGAVTRASRVGAEHPGWGPGLQAEGFGGSSPGLGGGWVGVEGGGRTGRGGDVGLDRFFRGACCERAQGVVKWWSGRSEGGGRERKQQSVGVLGPGLRCRDPVQKGPSDGRGAGGGRKGRRRGGG